MLLPALTAGNLQRFNGETRVPVMCPKQEPVKEFFRSCIFFSQHLSQRGSMGLVYLPTFKHKNQPFM